MNIFKPSFEDYLKNIINGENDSLIESILLEMPLKPVRFQNDSGEYDDEQHHVVSTLPIFMDWDDIYYLYQFPSQLWSEANAYRYVHVIYNAKKHQKYEDIQDITLSASGTKYTFYKRNTFGKKLIDKIERTVDVEHFMNAKDKTPEGRKAYQDQFSKNKSANVDMGGYIGADMSNPVKTDFTGDLWSSKGFMGPDAANIKQRTASWINASSHGLLGNVKEYGNTYATFSTNNNMVNPSEKTEGKRVKQLLTVSPTKLQEIAGKMQQAGAVPFVILKTGKVYYENVKVIGANSKVKSDGKYPSNRMDFSPIPLLLPGKAIDSKSNEKYEALLAQEKNMHKVNSASVKNVESYQQEIDEISRDLQNGKYKGATAIDAAKRQINQLMVHVSFDKFIKDKNLNPKSLTNDELRDLKIEFERNLHSQYQEVGSKAKSYDNYDWNFHRFNRERENHDPLNVGMDNPFELGNLKFGKISRTTSKYGSYEANKQSKSMIHGEEGDWEKHFKDIFGTQNSDGGKNFKAKFGITSNEAQEIEREANKYLRAIGKKLASNSEVISYLKLNSSNAQSVLSSFNLLKEALIQKGVYDVRKNLIMDNAIPKELHDAFHELKNVEKSLYTLEEESKSGYSKSDIQSGVESHLTKPAITNLKVLKAILEANKSWIIINAENFVKRNLGETPFLRLKKIFENPGSVTPVQKYKALLDAKKDVQSLAQKYAETISQLKFGSEDSITGQGILSRRNREGKDNRSTSSMTASSDDANDMDFGVNDDIDSVDSRIDNSDDNSSNNLSQSTVDKRSSQKENWEDDINSFVSSFFGETGKSSVRKFRSNSDSTTQQIGHNVSTLYTMMQEEGKRAAQRAEKSTNKNSKELEIKNKSSVSRQEMQMLKGINNSLELYNFFISVHKNRNLKGDAIAWAKERMNSVLKRNNLSISSNDPKEIAMAMRYQPVDQAEHQAVTLYQKLEAESDDEQDLSDKIVDMSKKVNSTPNADFAKHIVDRLRLLNQEPQIFNTYKIAATNSDVVQNVDLNKGVKEKLRNVVKKHGENVPGMGSSANIQIPQQMTPSTPVQTPVATPSPQGVVPPASMSLADRMRMRKQQQ